MKQFTVHAQFDEEAGVWWASNKDFPLTTEAPTFDQLIARVMDIAPDILEMNGHLSSGEAFEIHFTADRVATAVP